MIKWRTVETSTVFCRCPYFPSSHAPEDLRNFQSIPWKHKSYCKFNQSHISLINRADLKVKINMRVYQRLVLRWMILHFDKPIKVKYVLVTYYKHNMFMLICLFFFMIGTCKQHTYCVCMQKVPEIYPISMFSNNEN